MPDFACQLEALEEIPEKLYTRPALKKIFLAHSGIPKWLLTRSLKEGADFAETLARCWPVEGDGLKGGLASFVASAYAELKDSERLIAVWNECKTPERIVINHLLIGHLPEPKTDMPADPDLPRKSIQAELMYALLSGDPEYSFGLYQGRETVVFARVKVSDPALTQQLTAYIGQQTVEKKGPVKVVRPGLIGVISYTGLSISPRHKSGLKVEHPELESLFPLGGLWQANAFTDL